MDILSKKIKMQNNKLAYILPNLLTATSIFIAFMSIINTINKNFENATLLIFLSLILDGLDGRVARLTNTTSKFGMEFDSQADIIAFGISPAILLFYYCGFEFNRFGTIVSGIFIIFGAIRLARFNISTNINEPSVFVGIPIPIAASFIAIWILMFEKYEFLKSYKLIFLIATMFVAILMVSNIRYPSFKTINYKKSNNLKTFVIILISLSCIYIYPREITSIIISLYIIFGLLRIIIKRRKK